MIIRDVGAGGFVWVNRLFEEQLGLGVSDLEGEALVDCISPSDRSAVQCLVDAGFGRTRARHRTEGADPIYIDWELRTEDHGVVALGVLAGQADNSATRTELPPAAVRQAGSAYDTLADTLRAMALIVEDRHPGRYCSILLLDDARRHVSVGAGPSLPVEYNAAVEGLEIGPFVGSCGTAAYWNQPVVVENVQTEGLWTHLKDHAARAGVAACWSHPIRSRSGEVLGALALYNTVPSAPTTEERDGLEMAAKMVGLAIERGRAEYALRESEERYRVLYEDNPSMYFTLRPDGRVLSVNKYGAASLGYEVSELVGKPVSTVLHADDVELANAQLREALRSCGETVEWQLRKLRKDGSVVWVQEHARTVRGADGETVVLVVCEDIDQRKQYTSLVEVQSAVLESIARGDELATTLRLLCLRIERELPGSRGFVLLLDETGERLRPAAGPNMPADIWAALDGASVETSRGTCGAAAFRGEQVITMDVELDPDWESSRPLCRLYGIRSSWSTPLRSRSGQVQGTISICQSEARHPSEAEQRLMHAAANLAAIAVERASEDDALRRTQKLESLGLMAGGVAHDFNNLLVVVLGQSTLAQAKLEAHSPARTHIRKAVQASEQLADLTRQLLAYSGRGHFEMGPISLNQCIRESLHLIEVAVPKSVELHTELAEGCPLIEADSGQIQQIIMNLVLNAAEALDAQVGSVTIRTTPRELSTGDQRYRRHTQVELEAGPYVALEIVDNGTGMDAAMVARVFDPFFTTKATGRGLGLAAVLGIVRGHGGGVRVVSEPGKGTTFSLVFPASAAERPPVADSEEQEWVEPSNGTILVIDDEESVRDAVQDFLTHASLKVLLAASGAEGIVMYQRHADDIDLVILDLSMPGMDGEQALACLRELDPEVRVLLSSGYDEREVTQRFEDQNLAGFMQKPYRAGALIRKVFELLQEDERADPLPM